ncbi:MAG: phosphoribosylglycinamide formyltransferase [bacterium]|nr:phosphoribosylglycinamide formyltransferase [bacterium]
MSKLIRMGVLVSGSGTILQSFIDAAAGNELGAEIAVVISNRPESYALERARLNGIPAVLVDNRDYPDRADFERRMIEELDARGVDFVFMAGFLRVLTPLFVERYRDRLINAHPALLPAFGGDGFYGSKVHKAVLESGVKFSGCTAHFVTAETDAGPIIAQSTVEVTDDDTPESLGARVLKAEHALYPEVVRLFAEGRLKIEGNRVTKINRLKAEG